MKAYPQSKSWWYASPHKGIANFPSGPSSIYDWKSQFFFVSSLTPWGFPTRWVSSIKSMLLDLPGLMETKEAVVEELKQLEVPPYPKLLRENLLRLYSNDPAPTGESWHSSFCRTMRWGVLGFLCLCMFSIFLGGNS